jgi:hypothetical protein
MKRTVVFGVLSFVAASVLGPSMVLANEVFETEPNDPALSAQSVAVEGGSVTIHAELDPAGGDTDFFRFTAQAGDLVTVDIDGASEGMDIFGADTGGFNSYIALYGPGLTFLAVNNDSTEIDEGSNNQHDSFLTHVIGVSGEYTVGVTYVPRRFPEGVDGAIVDTTRDAVRGGPYTLIVSGVSAPVDTTQHVAIKVRPGEKHVVRLNPKSHEKLRVAILSSDTFDAVSEVDTNSLTFGQTGTESSLKNCRERGKDVNRDGYEDLICRFYVNKAGFEVGDTVGILKGTTKTGTPIEGHGYLKVKAEGRKHFKDHKGKQNGKYDGDDDDDDHRGKGKGKGRD